MTSLTPDPSTWRVLVVDDKPLNLQLAEAVLRPLGAAVLTSDAPQKTLELLKEFEANVLLLDIAMPDVSGWEIQNQLRGLPEFDNIAIIGFTALASIDVIERAKTASFDGYITKPFRVDAMVSELGKIIEKFLAHRASMAPGSG